MNADELALAHFLLDVARRAEDFAHAIGPRGDRGMRVTIENLRTDATIAFEAYVGRSAPSVNLSDLSIERPAAWTQERGRHGRKTA